MSQRGIIWAAVLLCTTAVYAAPVPVTYTDTQGDQVGSTNKNRDIYSASVTNDASNLIFTINLNPAADLAAGGNFNYGIGITTGSSTAGGDTSANATTHGNAYHRAISIDGSLGGMMDWVGIFGAGGVGANGSAATPFTSYGFNDYVFGTPNDTTTTAGAWVAVETVGSGEPITTQGSNTTDSSLTVTVPMADFAANFAMSAGTTIYFDIYSTGTSAGQTAYDSLADSSPTNATNSSTTQYNGTVLESYTIQVAPEPTGALVMGGIGLLAGLRRRK